MLLSSAHEAPDCYDRRFHDTQLAVARQEGAVAEQEGYGSRYIRSSTQCLYTQSSRCEVRSRYLVPASSQRPF